MNIVVGSAFRNSVGRLSRYFDQVASLQAHAAPGHPVRVIAAEGDSADATRAQLAVLSASYGIPVQVVDCAHGGPWFGSTEDPARLAAMTDVGNAILGAVGEGDDVLVYVESDLVWDWATAGALVDMAVARAQGFDVFAPLVFAGRHFYDVFAFRKDGARFAPFPPYHAGLAPRGLTEVDSAGSFLVMRAAVARAVRMPPGGVLVGWCAAARAAGYRIAASSELHVSHPA